MKKLILIKLGGSLITDKTKINVAKYEVIENLVKQIKEIIKNNKDLALIIATGAGGDLDIRWLKNTETIWKKACLLSKKPLRRLTGPLSIHSIN